MIFGWSDFREFDNDLSSKKMLRDATPADRQSDRRHAGKLIWVAMCGRLAIAREENKPGNVTASHQRVSRNRDF